MRCRNADRRERTQGYSSAGRVPVSKTVGRGFESSCPCQEKSHSLTRMAFFNDVCLRQMMLASPNDVRCANDVCLAAHWANIASLRPTGATSYLRSKCIISPQAMHHLKIYKASALIYSRMCDIIR